MQKTVGELLINTTFSVHHSEQLEAGEAICIIEPATLLVAKDIYERVEREHRQGKRQNFLLEITPVKVYEKLDVTGEISDN